MNRAENRRQKKLAKKAASIHSPGQQTPTLQQSLDLALQHQAAGRLPEAESLYQQILQTDPNQPDALHLLGVIAHQVGENELAVERITKALAIRPDYVQAHSNLGAALKGLGRLDDAVASYHKALAIRPDYTDAHFNLGNALKDLGALEEAVASYQKVIALKPDYAGAHSNLGIALKELGKLEEAVASYHKALAIKPDYAEAHTNLGIAFKELAMLDDAVASYQKALAINPDNAEALNNLGAALQDLGKVDEAVASYHKAIAIKPDYADAHINLCGILEKTNSTGPLREAVTMARRNCPGNPFLAHREAQLLKRDGDFAAARAVLEAAGDLGADARFLGVRAQLLGDLCDRLGDIEAAFSYFKECNHQGGDTPEGKRADAKNFQAQIDDLAKRFTTNWIAGWQELQNTDDRSDPVFLVGFPRSGTTLLDTILRSHPAISVVEEIAAIANVRQALERFPGGYPDALAALDPARLEELRKIYFAELDKHLKPNERTGIVVDKLPLNTVNVGDIHRIFPQARFVFALRHPCDCVLSCFMQTFKVNDAMANFLDLEDAAILYDKVMTLWQQYQEVLPLKVHTVRYENLIESFEETLRPLLDFLDVDWDDALKNYTETARKREKIDTPSYYQVTQPIYTRARGRWERYREHMQPVLPTLLPWAKRFGYDE